MCCYHESSDIVAREKRTQAFFNAKHGDNMNQSCACLEMRPYQVVRIIAFVGAEDGACYDGPRVDGLLAAVREDPLRPVTLRCNVSSLFRYQNPGRADDTPGGEMLNDRRDLYVLQRLGLCPGDTRPAVTLFELALARIEAQDVREMECERMPEGVRRPDAAHAISADYEKGRLLGLSAIMQWREKTEKAAVKAKSAAEVLSAGHLYIRPHHLMCMGCFYGGLRSQNKPLAPIEEDNLYEAIDAIHRNPEIPVTLIAGPCMICPPCGNLHLQTNLCISGTAMGMRDEKKDLEVLRKLDLAYGHTLPAVELYRRLFDAIQSTTEICGFGNGRETAPEWRVCGGPDGAPGYVLARKENIGIKHKTP